MKKLKDTQLFKRLRYDAVFVGLALIIFFLVDVFTGLFNEQILRIVILMAGIILIFSGLQKYLREHPKLRHILIWTLTGSFILGLILFFIVKVL
jgi:hypothetical protein